ncbi:hypothetical protein GCM10023107_63100 [Actinoplanes octamycinicus]|nr:hypothetical protein Aoc01nite_13640 [Actinoplanes octamycinicus]
MHVRSRVRLTRGENAPDIPGEAGAEARMKRASALRPPKEARGLPPAGMQGASEKGQRTAREGSAHTARGSPSR